MTTVAARPGTIGDGTQQQAEQTRFMQQDRAAGACVEAAAVPAEANTPAMTARAIVRNRRCLVDGRMKDSGEIVTNRLISFYRIGGMWARSDVVVTTVAIALCGTFGQSAANRMTDS